MNKNILIGLFLFVVINYSKPSGLNCGLWIVSFWFFVIFPFKFKRERQRQRDGDRERQRETEDIVLSCLLLSLFFFWTPNSLWTWRSLMDKAGWLTSHQAPPVSASWHWGYKLESPQPALLMSAGDLNSGFHDCIANTLPTELPPNPLAHGSLL